MEEVDLLDAPLTSFVVLPGTGFALELVGGKADAPFASTLTTFDVQELDINDDGRKVLTTKLVNVKVIQAMRLSYLGKQGHEARRLLACFPPSVWKTVEVLGVDWSQLPTLREYLTGSTSLQCLIYDGPVPSDIELPSLKELYITCNGDMNEILTSLKTTFPQIDTVGLNGRKFRLVSAKWEEEAQALSSTVSASFLRVLERGTPLDNSTTVSLPHFEKGMIQSAESATAHLGVLRGWCNSGQFEASEAHATALADIQVAVLDSGIDPTHPDLKQSLRMAANFVPGESFIDLNGHGTHCAGIIAGAAGGVVPGVQLLVAKVLNRHGKGSAAWVTAGVRWAIQKKVDIISMSLGMPTYDQGLHDAVQEAISKGIVVVCAAGNDGSRYRFNVNFPASIAGAIRVGSIGHYGASSSFSSVGGPQIDAAAIGEDVLSTALCQGREARYCTMSGTSMATPVVAAICAMLLAYDRVVCARHGVPPKLVNSHCMKDILGKLCFNSSQEVAKGRGSPDLAHVLRVHDAFYDHLRHIC